MYWIAQASKAMARREMRIAMMIVVVLPEWWVV